MFYVIGLLIQILFVFTKLKTNSEVADIIFFIMLNYMFSGFLLYKVFLKNSRFYVFERISIYFVLSFILVSFLSFPAYIFHFPFYIFQIILSIVNTILVIYLLSSSKTGNSRSAKWNRYDTYLLLISCLLCIGVYFFSGFFLFEDVYQHASQIQKIADRPVLSTAPHQFIMSAPSAIHYARNSLYAFVAIIVNHTGHKTIPVFIVFSILLVPVIISSYYLFYRVVFGSRQRAFFATLLFILMVSIYYELPYYYPFKYLTTSIFCKWFATIILSPLGIAFIFKYLSKPQISYLVIIIGISVSICNTHLLYFLYFIFLCMAFLLYSCIKTIRDKSYIPLRNTLFKLCLYIIGFNIGLLSIQHIAIRSVNESMPSSAIGSLNESMFSGAVSFATLADKNIMVIERFSDFYFYLGTEKYFLLHPLRYSNALFYIAALFLLASLINKGNKTRKEILFLLSSLWLCFFCLINPFLTKLSTIYGTIVIFERLYTFFCFLVLVPVISNGCYRMGLLIYMKFHRCNNKFVQIFLTLIMCFLIFASVYSVTAIAPDKIKVGFTLSIVLVFLIVGLIRLLFGFETNLNTETISDTPTDSIRQYSKLANQSLYKSSFLVIAVALIGFWFFKSGKSPVFSQYNQSVFKERYISAYERFLISKKPYIDFIDNFQQPVTFVADREQTYEIVSNTKHFSIPWNRMGFGIVYKDVQYLFDANEMGKEEIYNIAEKYNFDYICLDLTQMPEPHYISQNKDLFKVVFRDLKMIIIKVNRP